jgi:transposase-like protein
MNCPYCQQKAVKNGKDRRQDDTLIQTYRCKACSKRFNELSGTPMQRLRTSVATVSKALKGRTEGLGVRATARVFDVSHSTVIRWEQRVASKASDWSPSTPKETDITVEGDELYTRVERNFPPSRLSRLDN